MEEVQIGEAERRGSEENAEREEEREKKTMPGRRV